MSFSAIALGLMGNFKDVPYISKDLKLNEINQLIPPGFEDIISWTPDEVSQTLLIQIMTDDNRENTTITVPKEFFNPSEYDCTFPQFLIEREFKNSNIDYFANNLNDRFIFNQNELFFITLQHRLLHFKQYKNAYGNLVNSDIKALKSFINYIPNTAYNSIQKDKHSYIILSLYDYKTKQFKYFKNNNCLGTLLKNNQYFPNEFVFNKLLDTLPIHYSSESMGGNSKYVLQPYTDNNEVYRCIGHKTFKHTDGNWYTKSLFPPKQNLPARSKTHVTANAIPIYNFKPTSLLIQDYLPNIASKTYEPKDQCYIRCIVAIHPILENNKFLYGEVEASAKVVNTLIIERESIVEEFEKIQIEIGQTIKAVDNKIQVGINIENEPVYLNNCHEATLMRNEMVSSLGVHKLVFNVVRKAGNARLDSNSGLKGVTVCKPNLGRIVIPSLNIDQSPDLVFGMNSFKTKENGIALARATLAVELGLYKPKHVSGMLNTNDETEILTAANALPAYEYYDMFGVRQTVQIGVIYVRFTELCNTYKSYGKQAFSFESGRFLHSLKDKTLFNEIWSNYIEQDRKDAVLELEKILLDNKNIFQEDLPTYTISQIQNLKLFKEEDLILNIMVSKKSESKLLDEDWNKGFFLDLTSVKAGILRIPSAKLLNLFSSQAENKMFMYTSLVTFISRVLRYIIQGRHTYLITRNERPSYLNQYHSEIKSILYSDEEASIMMIQTLSRPQVTGFAMKQNTDYLIPPDTCVIFDQDIYNRAISEALGPDHALHELKHGFYGMHIRAPSLWRKQIKPLKIWDKTSFRMFLHYKYGIKLEDYITPELNKDIILFSNNILDDNQSDADGDHSNVYTPAGLAVQEALRNYNDHHITKNECDWIVDYIKGEREANDDLINPKTKNLNPVSYTLYNVPLHDIKVSRKESQPGFSTYLKRAITSKANIGVSTNDQWTWAMILSCYTAYGEQNNWKYTVNEKTGPRTMRQIHENEIDDLSFAYTKALQNFVVRGVKHTSNGSEDFDVLFLRNITKDTNRDAVYNLLHHDLGLSQQLTIKFIIIVNWANEMNFIKTCAAFLKLYNKGTIPNKELYEELCKVEEFIQQNTYFGMLLKDVYDLRQQAKQAKEIILANATVKRLAVPVITSNSSLDLF